MLDLTRREFLATSAAASAAALLPCKMTRADNGQLSTGFASLDELIGGLRDGWLVVIAAWPGMGKTALAHAFAQQTAVEKQLGTLFVTLEMSQHELARRLLCSRSGVPCQTLRHGNLSCRDREMITNAGAELSRSLLFVSDQPTSVARIRKQAKMLNREHLSGRLRLLVVDSLQLIGPSNDQEYWTEQILQVTSDLKCLAVELDVPVVCTVPLDAAAGSGRNRRPRLSDLRATGPIEPYTDLILFAHREVEDRRLAPRAIPGEAELFVAKHRSGPVGCVDVHWDRACVRFKDSTSRTAN